MEGVPWQHPSARAGSRAQPFPEALVREHMKSSEEPQGQKQKA